jgi:osmotically-inducible protein OsmY
MRLLSFALVLTSALAGCAVLEPRSAPEDEKITTTVENSIHQHPDLGPPNLLYVKTTGHVVYLSGIADTGLQSRTAEALALETAGVTRVVNNISVSH